MKLYIKQNTWSTWSIGNSKIDHFVFDLQLNKRVIVKKGFSRSSNSYDDADFSFTVLEIGNDFIKWETNGNAGGVYDQNKQKYLPVVSILKVGEIKTFYTKYFDVGANFDVTIK